MLRFLKSLTGQIVLMVALAGFVAWTVYQRYSAQVEAAAVPPPEKVATKVDPLATTNAPATPTAAPGTPANPTPASTSVPLQTGQTISRFIVPETRATNEAPPPPSISKEDRARMLAAPEPLTLFTSESRPRVQPPAAPAPYAPYGRMIRCKLVTGLESSNLSTPLVAITTEDLWHRAPDGTPQLIIPAGVEVHGPPAAHGRTRDRLAAAGRFVFVWRTNDANNGRELPVEGIALTRAVDPASGAILPDDATGGLRGDLLESATNAELKLFAAAFLKASASAGYQTTSMLNPLTNQSVQSIAPNARNAAITGVQAVMDEFANRIRKQLDEEGCFVSVPAGRDFYVYVPQTIDLSAARQGGIAATPDNSPSHASATP